MQNAFRSGSYIRKENPDAWIGVHGSLLYVYIQGLNVSQKGKKVRKGVLFGLMGLKVLDDLL
jgi:hypothetical protein